MFTKELWNKHRYSSRHLHTEVNGYWSACFPQGKLTRTESSKLEKDFWEKILGSENAWAVYGFLKAYFMMVTNMNDYVKNDDDTDDDFWCHYRDNLIAQVEQDL